MKYAYSLLYTLIICLLSLSGFTACSGSEEVSKVRNQSDSKSDSLNENRWTDETEEDEESSNSWENITRSLAHPGDGQWGGYELISAEVPVGCNAYKIDDRAFVTTALCLAEVIFTGTDIAVVATIDSGNDLKYLGLTEKVAVSNKHADDFENGIGIIYLDRSSSARVREIIDLREGQVQVLGADREIKQVEGTRGYLQANEEECSADSVAVTDKDMGLVGLSLGRRGQCNEFLYLSAFSDFIDEALREGFRPTLPQQDVTAEEREAAREAEEIRQQEDERQWAEEEMAALSRAPACDMPGETYCDGNIELTCQGTTYRAFNCGRVGWTCDEDSRWGASCEP